MKTENENAQASALRQEISPVITKFEKHTYEQMTFDLVKTSQTNNFIRT